MRAIRLFFIVLLAAVLILVALANRGAMTVSLLPENLTRFTGGQWSVTMPAFLALFLAMVFGLLIGLVWEWMRESSQRAEAKARARELARLEREVGDLRRTHAKPRDEVLAILDDASARPASGAGGASVPALR
ncbi:LapA family protein [Paracoccus sp. CPCC 101403]|uniref:LapA family protein n=2 Tax=Paracoccus broussonetiae TaxID=3075834 RepID=A0ABU3EHK9_9RHOB|nr:LapA family protein [Paracoccus sp. CPCC 101403]MDT1063733.1 LapA family protein [Paracoccus sp. CPCC 101403]